MPGSTFTVTVRGEKAYFDPVTSTTVFLPDGGLLTAAGGIRCGFENGAASTACSADYPWGSADAPTVVTVTATPYAAGGYAVYAFAGSCMGTGSTDAPRACTLAGNSDKLVLVRFAKSVVALGGHPNISDGKVHGPMYLARAASGLDCYGCHGASLQGQSIAVSCGMCHELVTVDGLVVPGKLKVAPPATQPTIGFSPPAPLTGTVGQPILLSALATDPAGNPVTCTWSLPSVPTGSALTLATSGACSGTPGTASFTPDVEGAYVVRVAPSNQTGTAQATIHVAAAEFGGGALEATSATAGAELTEIATRLRAVLSKGYNTIMADVLMKDLVTSSAWGGRFGAAAAPAPGPFKVIDVRDPEDYAKGHIPGAINVPLAQIPSVLLANPALINDNASTHKVAVAGYNGGDANMASFLINVSRSDDTGTVGKPSFAIFGGMSAWSYDRELTPTRFDDGLGTQRIENGAIETAAQTASPGDYTTIGAFSPAVDDVKKKIFVRARAFLQGLETEAAANGVPHREAFWTTWVKYNAVKADGDPSNDPQVIDVRSLSAYAKHVPGAIFIPYQQVAGSYTSSPAGSPPSGGAVLDKTSLVDPNKTVFVYCVTGHTGGIATMALGVMGYQARNVLWAINGWSADASVVGTSLQKFDATRAFDFPQHDWPDVPATLVGWVPERTGCAACHTSQTAQWYDLIVNPLAAAPAAPASEGEG